MFFKVQLSAASIYRQRQDYSAELAPCTKALAIDPLCEIAEEEAMRVYRAQGRTAAIDRHCTLDMDSRGGFDRVAFHTDFNARVLAFFRQHLASKP